MLNKTHYFTDLKAIRPLVR